MTVQKLIKLLQKMPPKAKVAVDVSFSGANDFTYMLCDDLNPRFEAQVEMHSDWHENQRGKPHHVNMCILGSIVGDNLE